jgi:hypothetical protein
MNHVAKCAGGRSVSGINRRSIRQREIVAAFVETALADGPAKVSELERAARAAGLLGGRQRISQAKMFRHVKAMLRISSKRERFGRGGEWMWKLPSRTTAGTLEPQEQLPTDPGWPGIQTEHLAPICGLPPEFADLGGVPRQWREGVALLLCRASPRGVHPHRWHLFVEDCRRFIVSTWAPEAARLGWDEIALFGCSATNPLGCSERAGLSWIVAGGRILQLWADAADIQSVTGLPRPYRRRHRGRSGVRLPWEL